MSQQEPTQAYLYQRGPIVGADPDDPRIYAVSGPGTQSLMPSKGGWSYREHLFTKSEAEAVVAYCHNKEDAQKRRAFVLAMESMFKATDAKKAQKKARKRSGQSETLFQQDGNNANGSSL
jgi:hypothetical protein